MEKHSGFTLIETIIALAILIAGITVVAHLFAYSVGTASTTRDMTVAAFLAAGKLEELRVPRDVLVDGGSLDPASPTDGFWDRVSETGDRSIDTDTARSSRSFLRLWQIDGVHPQTITVAVFRAPSAPGRPRVELMRAAMRVNPRPQ